MISGNIDELQRQGSGSPLVMTTHMCCHVTGSSSITAVKFNNNVLDEQVEVFGQSLRLARLWRGVIGDEVCRN